MKQGYGKIPIRIVDTDVVVLAVTSAQRLNITELWIAFGARKNFQHWPAYEMANALGPESCFTLQCLMPSLVVTCFRGVANELHGTGVPVVAGRNLLMEWGSSSHKKLQPLSSNTNSTYPARRADCSTSGHCWCTDDDRDSGGSISKWMGGGWNRNDNDGWKLCWTTRSEATQACRELLHCGCNKGCVGLCKGLKGEVQWNSLCYYGGLCARS